MAPLQQLSAGASSSSSTTTTTTTTTTPKSQRRNHSQSKASSSPQPQTIADFIPPYLRQFMHPYHGDFCVSKAYHPRILAQIMAEGFLPIATPEFLLPKLHQHRCVIDLASDSVRKFHVSKSARKKSKGFSITVNRAFPQVIDGCHEQHGTNCWLYPPLVEVLTQMNQSEGIPAVLVEPGNSSFLELRPTTAMTSNSHSHSHSHSHGHGHGPPSPQPTTTPVRVYSIEVWNADTGALAGGELGYTVGSIYTSLTGFARESNAGSVQLAGLGRMLMTLGYSHWDLGMWMEYKQSLGCQLMPRKQFVSLVQTVRATHSHLVLPYRPTSSPPPRRGQNNSDDSALALSSSFRYNAKDLVEQTIPADVLLAGGPPPRTGISTDMKKALVPSPHQSHPPPPSSHLDLICSPPKTKRQRSVDLQQQQDQQK